MKNRSYLREVIVKSLYQVLIYESKDITYDIEKIIGELMDNEDYFVRDTVVNILDKKAELVSKANKYLSNWTVDRLSKVDQAIILLGIYELLYTDTPKIVAINEAVELSKKYSDEKVVAMINAALDKLYHDEAYDE